MLLFVVIVRSHEPSLTQNVTAAPITTIAPHQVSSEFETSIIH